jgi:hypothetical protein
MCILWPKIEKYICGILGLITNMEQLTSIYKREIKTESMESQIKTSYLYNVRIQCTDNTQYVLPYAHMNYYNYKSKKHTGKQHVLTQVTFWEASRLPKNTLLTISAINDVPFRLWGSTDSDGRLTARDVEPEWSRNTTVSVAPQPQITVQNSNTEPDQIAPSSVFSKAFFNLRRSLCSFS